MRETLLSTPEGVRDIYGNECEKKHLVIERMEKVLHLYGNKDIETPTFEYFGIFNADKGSAPSNEMYKFFDRNNNTLVLRPDFTPSIARCVAKYFPDEELPIRLCYRGNTFASTEQHKGKLAETTQLGSELINDDSSAADAETVACVIDCLKATGLKDFQIEIGEVDYFKGIIEDANLDEKTENKIRDYIQIKNFFGLSEYISELDIADDIKKNLNSLSSMFGGLDCLDKAEKITKSERALEAIDRLRKVYKALTYYEYQNYISFDLSMINGYDYYTGIVFSGYTYGTGNPIVRGGRYNNLLSQFGKDAPSIGFSIYVDDLMNTLSRQKITIKNDVKDCLIVYTIEHQESALRLAKRLREQGVISQLIRKSKRHEDDEYMVYSDTYDVGRIYILQDEKTVRIISADRSVDEERAIETLEY
ncbi:ATP phosphoribosyltransferase regulatory subunit [Lachnospiraceae bacterium NE2001]|nr:ATP phosphoribosyltransferase regulatory subunit [Lachnospiraceae bacterium NE2001]